MTHLEAAEIVMTTLTRRGHEAFLVGGCVRDILLGREPKDYDVTTNAWPLMVQALFPKTLAVGADFGVIVVMIDDIPIEVATYRQDGNYTDARRPGVVNYSMDVREDVVRRDFTINGLLMEQGIGVRKIIDYVGGQTDIEAKTIRCIGDPLARFTEDPLRMLRAVRFAAQLGFSIEAKTFHAIQELAPTIAKVSRERITAELIRLVTSPFPMKGIVPLLLSGLADNIFPLDWTLNVQDNARRFADVTTTDPVKGLAMFFADSFGAAEALESLKLSNDQLQAVTNALNVGTALVHGAGDNAARKRLARTPGFQVGVDLFEQDMGMGLAVPDKELISYCRTLTPEDINPKPLLTGTDLIAKGMTPGPEFGRILFALETLQLNGVITTREEAERRLGEVT
jgi:tRNA nucleotidyltransferase/poly(A) polymerase